MISITTSRKSVWLMPLLAFCSFLVGFDSIAVVPLLPSIAASTDMPLTSGGLLYASYALAYALTAPWMGSLSDRWNRKGVLLIGIALFGGATALVGMGNTFASLIFFRILTGIGAGMIEPVVYAIAGDAYSYEKRGRAMGVITAALISSSVIGVPLAGAVAEFSSWNQAFWLIAVLSAAALAGGAAVVPKESSGGETDGLVTRMRGVFGNHSVCFSLLGSFLYYGALQGMFVLAGVFYYKMYGLGSGETGVLLMAAGLSSIAGSLLGGRWADKRRKNRVIAAASVLSGTLVFALSLFTGYLWLSVLLHILWAAFYAAGQSAFTALISELDPKSRGTVMAFNSSAMYIGASAMSALAAALLSTGVFWPIGFMCGIANIFVMVIVTFAIRERGSGRGAGGDLPEIAGDQK
jgi:predicted MFS family arabinose efflux permease